MCGRFVLKATPEELQALFGYLDGQWFPPRYNIAPTQPIAVVRQDHGARHFALVRWGLIPAWVEEPAKFQLLINARAESALGRPAFRGAMQYRRCLVPASGFYEWRRNFDGRTRQPFWVRPRDGGIIAFAGLWESWMSPNGSEIDSGCIVTTTPNATLAPIHDRMPAIIMPADFDRWLDTRAAPPDSVRDLLGPAPDDFLEAIPVGPRVNAAKNDDPSLIELVEPQPAEPATPDLFG